MPEVVLSGRHSARPSADECDSIEKQIVRCRAYWFGRELVIETPMRRCTLGWGSGESKHPTSGLRLATRRHL
jgi:hypothetical protein